MTSLHFTLLADGPSDRVLLRHLIWLLRQHLPSNTSVQHQWADLRSLRRRPQNLGEKIAAALDFYPCDLLCIHRDAEREDPERRRIEIDQVVMSLGIEVPPFVPVIPIRMTEAWLLFDEASIRWAAGNPNGREPLPVPVRDAESVADPKAALREALRAASGLSGRRRQKFNVRDAVHRVAEYIEDFSPLRGLTAFGKLEEDLATVIRKSGWS